ncbi:Hint domain-containing protein [Sedimentitalea arenosa]|uniref:Hint domain-containing protein n=1 Tax=Sedimentitalea arenosa TaxID=2798803 RepID=A0A8J7JFV8_9RHOB|nr:Hint domain-containing protein [Arenibacterium arenosum]MBJ6370894.1 Hint domain-containing protein [Arenibacterium arenosum]
MTLPIPLNTASRRAIQNHPAGMADPAALRAQPRPQLRRYSVWSLLPGGTLAETRRIAPALPIFEDAFCAFSRGSMVETEAGAVAVEDLLPGDRIVTQDGVQPLLWKGSTTLVPGRSETQGRKRHLARIMADGFGVQRPMSCVIAGPSARLLHTPPHLRAMCDGAQMLTPIQEFIDGMTVIETAPPTPVELFHLGLARHAAIRVNGLEFETYHPGPNAARLLSQAMRPVFLSLFPHVDQLCDFGPLAFARAGDGQHDAVSA